MDLDKMLDWKTGWFIDTEGKRFLAVWPGPIEDGKLGHPVCLLTPEADTTDIDRMHAEIIVGAPKMIKLHEQTIANHEKEMGELKEIVEIQKKQMIVVRTAIKSMKEAYEQEGIPVKALEAILTKTAHYEA